MEKLDPKLLLNFERPIGTDWQRKVIAALVESAQFELGHILVVKELIVPSVPGNTGINLAALGNAIYTAAREANMSLAGYGHLDPIKFVFASMMLALIYEEIKRDLRTYNSYQFGNRTCGKMLLSATTGLTESVLLNTLPSILLKMDTLCARINSLYIPAIAMFKDLLPHRAFVYKDDEGDRYQLYFYRMANYYELIVDPTSPMVGQLKCKFINRNTTVTDKISVLENLLDKYEGDEDFVNFATEAVKAGLPRLQVNKLSRVVSDNAISIQPMEFTFDIDDICSLENACVVQPVVQTFNSDIAWNDQKVSWDVYESPTDGSFYVGKMGSTNFKPDIDCLPVLNPVSYGSQLSGYGFINGSAMSIPDRPLFTRAKVTSEEGLYHLTKYVVGYATPVSPSSLGITATNQADYVDDTNSHAISASNVTYISKLSCHSAVLVHSFGFYHYDKLQQSVVYTKMVNTGNLITDKASGTIASSYTLGFTEVFRGYKFTPYVYFVGYDSNGVVAASFKPIFKDFDYITSVDEESLNIYNSAHLWNGFIMLSVSASTNKSNYRRSKRKGSRHSSKPTETGGSKEQPDKG